MSGEMKLALLVWSNLHVVMESRLEEQYHESNLQKI